jgi:hypothetical protein
VCFACFVGTTLAPFVHADPLSKKTDIDFFRDVPSRNLKRFAARSDGRLVSGPILAELAVPAPADLLWSLEATSDPTKFLVGTGPDGKILEITYDIAAGSYASRDLAKLDSPQVFAVKPLADGSVLAGTSPKGALYLIRDGAPLARIALPVDSIVDLLLLDADTALAATGNPGRIYRIDLKKFATAGVNAEKITDAAALAERGLTLFGEVRDRNVRRLALFPDGRVVAGSSPKGNIYTFTPVPSSPTSSSSLNAQPSPLSSPLPAIILQENRDAEVTDLLVQPNGDLYASIVYTGTTGESRITPPATKSSGDTKTPEPPAVPSAPPEKFSGRSSLIFIPANGYPEVASSRANTAFYRLARQGDIILIAAGELGELYAYETKSRLGLTLAGSVSSQLNGIVPIPGAPSRFLLLRNNVPGFSLLDFATTGPREAETRRLDLGLPAQLGALRFNRVRNLTDAQLSVEIRTSSGSDDLEGWGPWTALSAGDGGWRADGVRGRYFKLRVRALDPAPGAPSVEIDKANLFVLPQNRRPTLQDFRLITPNYGLIAAVEQPPSPTATLSQLMSASPKDEDAKRKSTLLASQIAPSPGSQVVFWTVTDPDGDNVLTTFSIRRDGDTAWTDIAANTRDSFAQFDGSHFPDGVYFTRLVSTETAPRPAADRLTATFETDDLIIDHTKPEILEATARRDGDRLIISVSGRDALSLLDGIEVIFNNGHREVVEQPDDGIRDSRQERFTLEIPLAKVSNATGAEVGLYDAAGNGAPRRLTW